MGAVEQAKLRAKLKMKAKGAWAQSKSVTPKVRGFTLPTGLKNAAAQFIGYDFDETDNDAADPYFRLKFVIAEPVDLRGKQFSIFHFINEATFPNGGSRTIKDCLDRLSEDLQKIGGADAVASTNDIDDVFPVLDQMSEEKPFVEFHTWTKRYKQGKRKGESEVRAELDNPINEDTDKGWYDALVAIENELVVDDGKDGDPPPPTSKASAAPAAPARGRTPAAPPAQEPTARRGGRAATPAPEPEAPPASTPRRGGRAAAPAPPPAEPSIQVDDLYGLELDFKEGKKTVTKAVEVRVTEVNEEAQTCTVEYVDTGDLYEDVKFDELKDPPAN